MTSLCAYPWVQLWWRMEARLLHHVVPQIGTHPLAMCPWQVILTGDQTLSSTGLGGCVGSAQGGAGSPASGKQVAKVCCYLHGWPGGRKMWSQNDLLAVYVVSAGSITCPRGPCCTMLAVGNVLHSLAGQRAWALLASWVCAVCQVTRLS
jgi:hypothetical protein